MRSSTTHHKQRRFRVGRPLLPALVAGVVSWLLLAASASAAVDSLPALAGVVRDACSGRLVSDASESLIRLSRQTPPSPIRQGAFFAYQTLPAGDYALAVSAPGYQPIGGGGGQFIGGGQTVEGQGLGAPIATPPNPIVPPGAAVIAHLSEDVRLMPPGTPCTPPSPILPPFIGAVRDAVTGELISETSLTLTSPSGQTPPSPIRAGGLFAFGSLPPGDYTLQVSAPGYQTLTNIPYTQTPPNPIFPGGSSVELTTALDLQLAH